MMAERHGWVTTLPGGIRSRCGGPNMCEVCLMEYASADRAIKDAYDRQAIAAGDAPVDVSRIGVAVAGESKDPEAESNRNLTIAFNGKRAWRNKALLTENPYPKHSSDRALWDRGWMNAQSAYLHSDPPGE